MPVRLISNVSEKNQGIRRRCLQEPGCRHSGPYIYRARVRLPDPVSSPFVLCDLEGNMIKGFFEEATQGTTAICDPNR